MKICYFDHNATTPLDPRVLESMLPYLEGLCGNPSSIHSLGRRSRVAIDEAREKISDLIGSHPSEIVFTSGGTEADNMAIMGVAKGCRDKGDHVITSSVEHPAILNPCRQLERMGFKVDYLPVNQYGRVDPEVVRQAITPDTTLISLQHANSEVGTIQPIDEVGAIAKERGVVFHVDAVQSAGKVPIRLKDSPIDLLSLSAHKMYGPKGVGALFVRKGTPKLFPLISGGAQEKYRRGGTENVASIVGFGQAAVEVMSGLGRNLEKLKSLKTHLIELVEEKVPGYFINSDPDNCLPNTLSFGSHLIDSESILIRFDLAGIAVSAGTACQSGNVNPSEVLTAMGLPVDKIRSTLRVSLGQSNTLDEVDRVILVMKESIEDILQRRGEKA